MVATRIKKQFLIYCLFVLTLLLVFISKPSFDINDGFYSQVRYIMDNGFSFDLSLIHAIRFSIMSPIIFYKLNENIIFLCIGLLFYTMPLYIFYLSKQSLSKITFLLVFLIINSIIFSERTFVAILGFLYLLIFYTEKKVKELFLFSFIFSILSSGTLGVFLIYAFVFNRYIYKISAIIKLILLSFLSLPIVFSIQNKILFFKNQENGFMSIIQRSKIWESYLNNNDFLFVFLIFYFFTILIIIAIFLCKNSKLYSKHIVILAVGLLTFLVEGLALYTYFIAIYFLFLQNLTLSKKYA